MDKEAKSLITRDSLDRLQKELDDCIYVKRPEIEEKIKEARAQGDLSENAEYDAAREAQRENEGRIEQIKHIMAHSVVVDESDYNENEVGLGKTVSIKMVKSGSVRTVSIVGVQDANSLQNMISNESPVGAALMKHEVGDIVDVELANGNVVQYEILSIEKTKKD